MVRGKKVHSSAYPEFWRNDWAASGSPQMFHHWPASATKRADHFFFLQRNRRKKSAGQVDKITAEKIDCAFSLRCHTPALTLHAQRTTRARPGTGSEVWKRKQPNSLQIAAGHKSPAQIASSQGNATSIAAAAAGAAEARSRREAVVLSRINKVNMSPSMWSKRWSHQVINVHHQQRLQYCTTITTSRRVDNFSNKRLSIIQRTSGPCTPTTFSTLLSAAPPITSS